MPKMGYLSGIPIFAIKERAFQRLVVGIAILAYGQTVGMHVPFSAFFLSTKPILT